MPIPQNRNDLNEQLADSIAKLDLVLRQLDETHAQQTCVDGWSVRDLLAVRVWWSEQVLAWVLAGRNGQVPDTPAPGYSWRDTPQLNEAIIQNTKARTVRTLVARLRRAQQAVQQLIDQLDDDELLSVGRFEWAGKHPVSRWLSINTVRQYETARTHLRRVVRR